MSKVRTSIGTACFIVLAFLGCAERQGPGTPLPDVVDADTMEAEVPSPPMDVPLDRDVSIADDRPLPVDVPSDVMDAHEASLDGPIDDDAGVDLPLPDARLDVSGDLPRVVLGVGKASNCNDLYVHTVVQTRIHTTPPPYPLRRGSIPPGYYVLIAADSYPDRTEDGGLVNTRPLLMHTVRVRAGTSIIQIARAGGQEGSYTSLYRTNCEFNPRATDPYYFCPVICIHPATGVPGVPGFREYEVDGDLLRLQFAHYLLTLQRVGPP